MVASAFPPLFIFSSSAIGITDELAMEMVDITALKIVNVVLLELMAVSKSSEELVNTGVDIDALMTTVLDLSTIPAIFMSSISVISRDLSTILALM